jgi:hypothetical protein
MFAYDTIYDDTNVAQIESLPPSQLHRDVDLACVEADKEGGFLFSVQDHTALFWPLLSS